MKQPYPDFKHRAMPDGGDYADFLPFDLFAYVSDKTAVITDELYTVIDQFKFPDDPRRLDESNINTLESARHNVLDVLTMVEWFLANFEMVRHEGEPHPEEGLPLPTDPLNDTKPILELVKSE
ncbi:MULTISPECIES: hypothetical protein [Methylomicrobium]|uniref:Uncharacterized protein n=1 Tax=Methylomicrobium album BG8 TaxID=686340 RepID=H8GLN4_METAL|nr:MULTISPECIES: hypothetical protein [Methylomicrobium]EIC30561.1 hypothetical protein Metal_2875 [Methylomicrobium album BG8]